MLNDDGTPNAHVKDWSTTTNGVYPPGSSVTSKRTVRFWPAPTYSCVTPRIGVALMSTRIRIMTTMTVLDDDVRYMCRFSLLNYSASIQPRNVSTWHLVNQTVMMVNFSTPNNATYNVTTLRNVTGFSIVNVTVLTPVFTLISEVEATFNQSFRLFDCSTPDTQAHGTQILIQLVGRLRNTSLPVSSEKVLFALPSTADTIRRDFSVFTFLLSNDSRLSASSMGPVACIDCEPLFNPSSSLLYQLTSLPMLCHRDCNNTLSGTAQVDKCNVCSGGNTKHTPNSDMDCAGVCFGTNRAFNQMCGCLRVGASVPFAPVGINASSPCFTITGVIPGPPPDTQPGGSRYCMSPRFGPADMSRTVLIRSTDPWFASLLNRMDLDWICNIGLNKDVPGTVILSPPSQPGLQCTIPASNANDFVVSVRLMYSLSGNTTRQSLNQTVLYYSFLAPTDARLSANPSPKDVLCDDCSILNRTFCVRDCAMEWHGPAKLDSCGVCSGGLSNHVADSDKDCNGNCFGGAAVSSLNQTNGGNADNNPGKQCACLATQPNCLAVAVLPAAPLSTTVNAVRYLHAFRSTNVAVSSVGFDSDSDLRSRSRSNSIAMQDADHDSDSDSDRNKNGKRRSSSSGVKLSATSDPIIVRFNATADSVTPQVMFPSFACSFSFFLPLFECSSRIILSIYRV